MTTDDDGAVSKHRSLRHFDFAQSFVQIPLIKRADNEDVQIAKVTICRLFGVGKNGTTVTYKQPDEDESTLASVW